MESLLISLLSLATLSLLTAVLRLVFGRAAALFSKAQRKNGEHPLEPVLEPGRRSRLGWASFAVALIGLYLPWILLRGWISHQYGVLNNPDMDDWEQGLGLLCLHVCDYGIASCEAAALCCGLSARRTGPGLVTCVLAVAVLYGITHHFLDDWYMVATHF